MSLAELEQHLRVYDAFGGHHDLHDLVTPEREFLREVDGVQIMKAPFSANEKKPGRLYLFSDLLLVGEENKERRRPPWLIQRNNSSQSSLGSDTSGKRLSSRLSARLSSSSGSSMSSSEKPPEMLLEYRLDLLNCFAEKVGAGQNSGVKITQVTREHDNDGKIISHIEMVEVFCENEAEADFLFEEIDYHIFVSSKEKDHDDRSVSKSSRGSFADSSVEGDAESEPEDEKASSTSGRKLRSFASSKSKLKRHAHLHRSGSTASGRGSGASSKTPRSRSETASTGSTDGGESAHGLSLKDIEQRYTVELGDSEEVAEVVCVMNEGPMGFSLSSGANLGIIVGKVAFGSMAHRGDVQVADRLVKIEKIRQRDHQALQIYELGLDTPWTDAVKVIKKLERPIRLTFNRNFKVNSAVQLKEEKKRRKEQAKQEEKHKEKLAALEAARKSRRERRTGSRSSSKDGDKRGWTMRHNRSRGRSVGSRITTLNGIESKYGEKKPKDVEVDPESVHEVYDALLESESENVRACASALQEIHETEKAYVGDLQIIVTDYLNKIRMKTRRVRCKDLSLGSAFCEHQRPRKACSRTSKDTRPVLEKDEIKDIFMNVEVLVKVNGELLDAIETGIQTVINEKTVDGVTVTDLVRIVAPAFVRIMPFFKMYSLYCHAYTQAIDRLLVLRTSRKELDEILKQRDGKTGTSLQHLLIKPVQRICKYPLLFQVLLKNIVPYVTEALDNGADTVDLDFLVQDLEKAMNTVDKIAQAVNTKVGEHENLARMMEAYTELGGELNVPGLISPSRRFVEKYDVLRKERPGDEPKRELVYVFNDLVVFAVHPAARFSVRRKGGTGGSQVGTGSSASTPRSTLQRTPSLSKMKVFSRLGNGGNSDNSNHDRNSDSASSRASSLTRISASTNGTLRTSGGLKNAQNLVTMRMDLHKATFKAIEEPDDTDCHGLIVSHVTRDVEEQQQPSNRKSRAQRPKSGKILTSVSRFELWLATAEKRDDVRDKLVSLVEQLKRAKSSTQRAVEREGLKLKQRNWKNRAKLKTPGQSRFSESA